MKRAMEYNDRGGWREEIDLSKGPLALWDNGRWWVGKYRWAYKATWPDLDRAWCIYYLKYIGDITNAWKINMEIFNEMSPFYNHFNKRFALLDEIDPSRKKVVE